MSDFTDLVDLAAERLGGAVLAANDEFFAPKENLLKASAPVFVEGKYTDVGKWMDGWESRRKRVPGHDWAVVRLGLPGVVRGVVVDTAFFKGNYPEACSIEACSVAGVPTVERLTGEETRWVEILPKSALRGDSKNLFAVEAPLRATHLRFNIYPDGGVARLRVHGEALPDWSELPWAVSSFDLAAVEHGALVLSCSDMFFGSRHNLIMPGPGLDMGDGWETKRRRGPGYDWVVLKLAAEGTIRRVEVDTSHFKGNYPDSCSIEVASAAAAADPASWEWRELLPRTKLQAHTRHRFRAELAETGPATHARFNIYPDGGVSRLRLYGPATAEGREREGLRHLGALSTEDAEAALLACCGSTAWATAVAAERPFASPEELFAAADRVWSELGEGDWLEAFGRHPRIGERRAAPGQSAGSARWSEAEQAGARSAAEETLAALEEGNRAYFDRFGYIFIVCATGRSADEMLALLRERLGNAPEDELRVAAEEQRRITRLRLEKLLRQ